MARATRQRCIAWAICCACLLNLSTTAAEALFALRKSPVAEAAIVSDKILETCHHHPQGCPKDCFCPKTRVSVDEPAPARSDESGTLRETSWVNCSEEGPSAPSGLFAVSLPEARFEISPRSARGARRLEAAETPREASLLPPQKIPIA